MRNLSKVSKRIIALVLTLALTVGMSVTTLGVYFPEEDIQRPNAANFSMNLFSTSTLVPSHKNNAVIVGDVYVEDYIDVGGWAGVLDLAMQRSVALGTIQKVYFLYNVVGTQKIFDLTDKSVTSFMLHPGTELTWNEIKDNIQYVYDCDTGELVPYEEDPENPVIDDPIEIDDQPIDLGKLYQLIADEQIEATLHDETSTIRTIDGEFTTIPVNDEEDALLVFKQIAKLLDSDESNLKAEDITHSSSGDGAQLENFYSLYPTINGVTVYGSDLILVVDENGVVQGLFTSYDNRINSVDTIPTIQASGAESTAINALSSVYSFDSAIQNDFRNYYNIESTLIIDNINRTNDPVLSWHVVVYSKGDSSEDDDEDDIVAFADDESELDIPFIDHSYYIYANGSNTGMILREQSNIQEAWTNTTATANDWLGNPKTLNIQYENHLIFADRWRLRDNNRNIETYNANSKSSLPGKIYQQTTGVNSWNQIETSAHANMARVYDFYLLLGRNSFDKLGTKIKTSLMYYTTVDNPHPTYNNAFWAPSQKQFVFGNSDSYQRASGCVDTMGHEFTHAVINTIVGGLSLNTTLDYNGESGALNESYADIMGSLIEGKSRTSTGRWLHGEDKRTVGQTELNAATRSLSQPSAKTYSGNTPYPEHYDNRYTGNGDKGGVHINSSIFNFAAYKMIMDTRTSGITDQTWAKIFYDSLSCLMTDATFVDARIAITHMAKKYDFTDAQLQAVKDAFNDVGIIVGEVYRSEDLFNLGSWEIYEHPNYEFKWMYPQPPNRDHSIVQLGTRSIWMKGFNEEAYKDFLFKPNNDTGVKTFFFDLVRNRDEYLDWHSIEGAGFLFNTTIDKTNNTIEGYCILTTQSGLKLVKINSCDLTRFRDGLFNTTTFSGGLVQEVGQLLTTQTINVPTFDNMSFVMRVSPTEISVWCNGVRILDKYQLPTTTSTSYGFGPITSHVNHSCNQLSNYTFSNIVMESK